MQHNPITIHGNPTSEDSFLTKLYKIVTLHFSSYAVPITDLEKSYAIRDPNEVTSFLKKNAFLISLLQEAYTPIKKHFPDSEVGLEVMNTSEVPGEEQLIAFIAVKLHPREASQELDYFDEEWWLNNMKRAKDKLCIVLEFL